MSALSTLWSLAGPSFVTLIGYPPLGLTLPPAGRHHGTYTGEWCLLIHRKSYVLVSLEQERCIISLVMLYIEVQEKEDAQS